jgi:hypothetical protein
VCQYSVLFCFLVGIVFSFFHVMGFTVFS